MLNTQANCVECAAITIASCSNPAPFCLKCNATHDALTAKMQDLKFAHQNKNYEVSDIIRQEIISCGFSVQQRKDVLRVSGSGRIIGRVYIEL